MIGLSQRQHAICLVLHTLLLEQLARRIVEFWPLQAAVLVLVGLLECVRDAGADRLLECLRVESHSLHCLRVILDGLQPRLAPCSLVVLVFARVLVHPGCLQLQTASAVNRLSCKPPQLVTTLRTAKTFARGKRRRVGDFWVT